MTMLPAAREDQNDGLQQLRVGVGNPSRSSRSGGPSPSSGSMKSDHYAPWIASSVETTCLSALGWTFMPSDETVQPG